METIVFLDQASDVGHHPGLIPEIAVLPEPATSSPAFADNPEPPSPEVFSEDIVTVERFLRYSAQAVPRTKQIVPWRKPRAYTRHRPAKRRETSVQRATKAPKRPQEPSRIANALFRAAVLTDGDPLDTLVDGAGISRTRRPLKFVPFNKFTAPFGPGEPNSVVPSHFSPIPHTRRHGNTSNLKQHHGSHPPVPLYLVPLREAEAAYSVMFP